MPASRSVLLVACLALLVAVVCLRATGFVGISNDDAARALIAWDFAHAPTLDPTRSSWLPAHTWTLGALLALWPDLDAVPRLVSLASTLASIALTLRIARALGATNLAALAALAIPLSWRWTLLPAAAGAVPEMPCVAWFLGAVALLQGRRFALAGACLTLACGHRYEAWFGGAALVVFELASKREGAWRFALTASLLPLAWLAINYARGGDALDFVHRVEAFRRAEGPLPPWPARALRDTTLLLTELPLLVVAAALGLRVAWRDHSARGLMVTAAATLALLTLGDLRGGGPTHHPARALTLLAWALTPIAAVGLSSLRARAWLVAVVVPSLVVGAPRPHDAAVSRDAVCAGDAVRRARITRSGAWFIEFDRQDALWVEARSGAPDAARADRAYGAHAVDPSRDFTRAPASIAAVSSDAHSAALRAAGLHVDARCGAWRVWVR